MLRGICQGNHLDLEFSLLEDLTIISLSFRNMNYSEYLLNEFGSLFLSRNLSILSKLLNLQA